MKSMTNAVKQYIISEDISCTSPHDAIIGDFEGWQFKTARNNIPQQRDLYNCGVFAFLSFMRVVFRSTEDLTAESGPIIFEWSWTSRDLTNYRRLIYDLFFDDTREEAVNCLKDNLVVYPMPEPEPQKKKLRK